MEFPRALIVANHAHKIRSSSGDENHSRPQSSDLMVLWLHGNLAIYLPFCEKGCLYSFQLSLRLERGLPRVKQWLKLHLNSPK